MRLTHMRNTQYISLTARRSPPQKADRSLTIDHEITALAAERPELSTLASHSSTGRMHPRHAADSVVIQFFLSCAHNKLGSHSRTAPPELRLIAWKRVQRQNELARGEHETST